MRRFLIQAIGTIAAVAVAALMYGGAIHADCPGGRCGISGNASHFGANIGTGGGGPIRQERRAGRRGR